MRESPPLLLPRKKRSQIQVSPRRLKDLVNRRGAQAPLDILKNESSDAGSGFLFDKKMRSLKK